MTELQAHVLNLLKEIDQLCRKNDIEFYLAAGSALGAVRHKGFIPWDDDADIYMTAENWAKFRAIRDQIPEGRALVTVDDGDFSSEYTINRYVDLTTTRLYRYLCSSPQPAGITVDILVLDPVPDDPDSIREHKIALTEYCDYLVRAALHATRCPWDTHDRENWARGEEIGREAMLMELKEKAERFRDTRGGVLVQRDPVVPHVWREAVFGKPRYVPFEDTEMPIAEHYYEQLCGAFNEEWMYVPESVGREEHIKSVLFDISNNNAFDDYLAMSEGDDIREVAAEFQRRGNFLAPLRKKDTWERLRLAEVKVKLQYRKKDYDAGALRAQLAVGRYEELEEFFADYEQVQCHRSMIGGVAVGGWLRSQKPFYIDLGDDFLYVFLRQLMHRPFVGKARVILEGRLAQGEGSPQTEELAALIEKIHELSGRMEAGDFAYVAEEGEALRRRYPENLALFHLYYGARCRLCRTAEERQALQAELEDPALDAWREDPVREAIRAELLWQAGEREAALDIYEELAESAHHGLVLLAIRERMEQSDGPRAERILEKVLHQMGEPSEDEGEEGQEEEDSRREAGDE